MKKFLVILLILMLLAMIVDAAENQSIIFSGSYSINNEATDADSAWLYIFNNATLVDSTTVTAEDLQWDGCYQYAHTCTNDSTDGWTGWWVYFGESEAVSIGEWAIVATARDSSYALESSVTALRDTTEYLITADTTGIAQDVYAEFTDGSNEDAFKATGFSTFDPATDSTFPDLSTLFARMAADSVRVNLLPGVIDSTVYDTASMRYFFELFFTSALTLAQQLDTAHTAIKAVRDTAQYLVTADVSALALEATIAALNDFDSETDLVKVKEIKANVLGDTTLQDNATEYKADVSGLSTLTDNELRTALGDSLYNERTDSLLTMLTTVKGDVLDIAYYWGACDGCYYRLFPEGGLTNKDSAIIIDPSLGPDSLVGKIIYLHGTEPTVYDSAYFYRDEPW